MQGGWAPVGAAEEGVCADMVAGRGRAAQPPVEADRARQRPRARPHHPGLFLYFYICIASGYLSSHPRSLHVSACHSFCRLRLGTVQSYGQLGGVECGHAVVEHCNCLSALSAFLLTAEPATSILSILAMSPMFKEGTEQQARS